MLTQSCRFAAGSSGRFPNLNAWIVSPGCAIHWQTKGQLHTWQTVRGQGAGDGRCQVDWGQVEGWGSLVLGSQRLVVRVRRLPFVQRLLEVEVEEDEQDEADGTLRSARGEARVAPFRSCLLDERSFGASREDGDQARSVEAAVSGVAARLVGVSSSTSARKVLAEKARQSHASRVRKAAHKQQQQQQHDGQPDATPRVVVAAGRIRAGPVHEPQAVLYHVNVGTSLDFGFDAARPHTRPMWVLGACLGATKPKLATTHEEERLLYNLW